MLRIGIGYDIHRLEPGRPLVLGGVRISFDRGLIGHSDADVLTHAIMDALLGAAGLPDIGQMFPNNDPALAGADSIHLLERVVAELRTNGWQPGNVDAVVICEAPKVAPHRSAIQNRLGAALGVPASAVGIKATTSEGIGALGAGTGIAVHAVATVVPRSALP